MPFVIVVYFYLATQKPRPFKFEGSHILVTGGSSGIGAELALELTKRGCHVSILARDEKKLKETHDRMDQARVKPQQNLLWFSCDVSSYAALSETVPKAAKANGGRIDALVCSAGVTNVTRFLESPPSHIENVMKINFNGCAYATYLVAPYMKEQKAGRIIFVGSILGLMGAPGYSVYAASKFALKGFAESLHSELSPFNIYFSIATPSNVLTPMFEEEEKVKSPECREIEASSGQKPVPPEIVAGDIIQTLENWRFLIPTGLDPWFVANISAGFAPASFYELLTQPIVACLGRLVCIWETKKMRDICKKNYK